MNFSKASEAGKNRQHTPLHIQQRIQQDAVTNDFLLMIFS